MLRCFSRVILRLNDELFFGKIALTRVDDAPHATDTVVLIVESPIEGFGAGVFRLMTEAVATYAEEYAREVEAIALDFNVATLAASAKGT